MPISVHVGLGDDVMVEIQAEGLTEGTKVVTGQDETQAEGGSSNPFLPKVPRGGKGGPPPPM